MRIAIIADIHGNLTSLDAVLSDLAGAGVDQVVCLGDVAATGPQPHETTERLRALGCAVVMGNADAALLRPVWLSPTDEESRRFAEIDGWCAAQLTPEDRAYLRTFQPTLTVSLGAEDTLLCVHGSPRSNTEGIVATTPEVTLTQMMGGVSARVMASGHTHVPYARRYRQVTLFNPGSVGLPYEMEQKGVRNPPWAEYALLDWRAGALGIELRRVPINTLSVQQAALRSGMPHGAWWASGWR